MSVGQWHDFEIPLANDDVSWVKDRVRAYRWFEEPDNAGWQYGASEEYLKRLQRYWLDHYSWRHAAAQINILPHFKVDVGNGFHLHCIHRRALRSDAIPILLCHGWPGSVLEFTHLVEQLAEPKDPAQQAFHVIVPSLPGYAWSDKPSAPMGPRAVARMYDALMTCLGYDHYIAQGGDWGCMIAAWLGLDAERCKAIHINGYGLRGADMTPTNEAETTWLREARAIRKAETAYLTLQVTKPQSLSYAMMDSPMGVAAWFVEKFRTWGDRDVDVPRGADALEHPEGASARPDRRHGDPAFSMTWLLTNIMIYLTTRSFNTSTWLYRGMVEEGGFSMPVGAQVRVPTGIANFPKDLLAFPPRAMVERSYNIAHWTEMPKGGHFASVETPDLFLEDIRDFAQCLDRPRFD